MTNKITYCDHEIAFEARDFTFTVTGPRFKHPRGRVASVEAAKKIIDEENAHERKSRKARLNFKVVNNKGEAAILTGIHGSTNKITLSPKIEIADTYGNGCVYVDTPEVRALIVAEKRLTSELHGVRAQLLSVSIRSSRGYQSTPEAYEAEIIRLQNDYGKAFENARKLKDDQRPKGPHGVEEH